MDPGEEAVGVGTVVFVCPFCGAGHGAGDEEGGGGEVVQNVGFPVPG